MHENDTIEHVHYVPFMQPRFLVPARPGPSARPVTAAAGSKRQTTADLKSRIQELEAENAALREALLAAQSRQNGDGSGIFCVPSLDEDAGLDAAAVPPAQAAKTQDLSASLAQAQAAAANAAASNAVPVAAAAPVQSPSDILEQLEKGIKWPTPGSPAFWEHPARDAPLPLTDGPFPPDAHLPPCNLHIVHVTAEMAPVAKVGGLGDVVTGLAKASIARGATVEVILPFYECIPEGAVRNLTFERDFECPKGRTQDGIMHVGSLKTQVWTGEVDGCPVILLRPDWGATGSPLFRGGRIYGGSYNEAEAYLYFCRAALEYLKLSGRQPDVVHAHEWQAGAVPMLFWETYNGAFHKARPVLTIHNMDSSGECRQDEFAATGVSGDVFASVDKALDERTIGHNPERLCLLKGGVVYSSAVTTVSPTYATETLTGGAAGWLRSTLARPEVSSKYWGVLNGIDTESWDPATDPALPACFSADHPQGKALCKRFLQRGLGLAEDPAKPLVAVVTRLVPQKGIHLIEHSVGRSVELGGQFVLLGTGHADGGLRRMAGEQYRDSADVKMVFAYSETLARMIYAAADIFLVPSMFEPCGLTQMIALRYGAVPVVRSTGGLADTVKDVDTAAYEEAPAGAPRPNGFVFEGIDAGSLESALDRAVAMCRDRPEEWAALCAANMRDSERWSWKAPAESYLQLYNGVLSR